MVTGLAIRLPASLVSLVRRRFALSLFSMQLLYASAALSQRSSGSFALLTDYQLGFRPNDLAVGPVAKGRLQIAIAEAGRAAVHLYELGSSPRLNLNTTLATQIPLRCLTAADLNRDGVTDYVGLGEDGLFISLLIRQRGGTWKETRIELPAKSDRCTVADVNNDGRPDVLLFGRASVGVATVLGLPRGQWKLGPVLFPEISVSDLKVRDLNGDGVNDIFALDWLGNELLVFYGLNNLVYTEHVTLPLDAEPQALALSQGDSYGTFLCAITSSEARKVFIYAGNPLGDYRLLTDLDTDDEPLGVQFTRLNSDGEEDLVAGFSSGVYVALGTPAGFARPIPFGVCHSLSSWAIADVDLDEKPDCVMLDEATQRLVILLHADAGSRFAADVASESKVEYAVGVRPRGLLVADFNGDGWLDVAVANEGSRSVSLLLNKGRGRLAGQVVISTHQHPEQVHVVGSARIEKTLVVAHPSENVISIASVGDEPGDQRFVTVPTGNEPRIAFAVQDSERLKFIVRYKTPRQRSLALSLFEQIADDRFVERSLRPPASTPLTALWVDQGSESGTYELVYAAHSKSTYETTVWHAWLDSGMQVSSPQAFVAWRDSVGSEGYLLYDYINRDADKDVVVVVGPPTNALGIWYGGEITAHGAVEWIRDVMPRNSDAIIIKDVNGDDTSELVWVDGLRDAVVAAYGLQRRAQPRLLQVAPAAGAASLRIAGIRGPGSNDLILSHPDRGTVSIIAHPFRR